MPHATIRPARLRFHSTDLSCDVAQGIGFYARCACGWKGPIKWKHSEARESARAHLCRPS